MSNSSIRIAVPMIAAAILGLPALGLAQSVEEEVTAAYAAWDEAFNAGDAGAVAGAYAEDALFLPATHDVIEGPGGSRSSSPASSRWASPTTSSSSSKPARRATP
jgi:hypothetical protein